MSVEFNGVCTHLDTNKKFIDIFESIFNRNFIFKSKWLKKMWTIHNFLLIFIFACNLSSSSCSSFWRETLPCGLCGWSMVFYCAIQYLSGYLLCQNESNSIIYCETKIFPRIAKCSCRFDKNITPTHLTIQM